MISVNEEPLIFTGKKNALLGSRARVCCAVRRRGRNIWLIKTLQLIQIHNNYLIQLSDIIV